MATLKERPRSERVALIRQTRLFYDLSKRQLDAIAKACSEHVYEPGEALVKQLDHGQQMVILSSGKAKVVRSGRTIGHVKAGDVVGEMSLIDGQPCSASVIAETPVEGIVIYGTTFRKLLDEVPSLARRLLATQTARIRELDAKAAALG